MIDLELEQFEEKCDKNRNLQEQFEGVVNMIFLNWITLNDKLFS